MYTLTAPLSPATSVGKHFIDMSAAQLTVSHFIGFNMNNTPEVKRSLKCLDAGAY